jgi:release factor glutamine methyltransferase
VAACSERVAVPLEVVRDVERELRAAGVPSPRVDAEILVADVLGLARSELYSSAAGVDGADLARLRPLVERRVAREPLAYVLGEWGFRYLTLKVDSRALIPRPETEIVVERCLAHLEALAAPCVLDIGAGSGAIALALATEHPGARVLALDSSEAALALARENVARSKGGSRVRLVHGSLLDGIESSFDLVVSNPPYVTPEEYETLQPEIRLFEPVEAVVGVGVGAAVAAGARSVLVPGGRLVLECGDGQAAGLAAELRVLGYVDVLATPDLAGCDRVVEGAWPS